MSHYYFKINCREIVSPESRVLYIGYSINMIYWNPRYMDRFIHTEHAANRKYSHGVDKLKNWKIQLTADTAKQLNYLNLVALILKFSF